MVVHITVDPHQYWRLEDGNYYSQEYVAHTWKKLYEDLIARIAKSTIGRSEHFIVKFYPMVQHVRAMDTLVKFELSADVMVAEAKDMVVPVFKWVQQNGGYVAVEWRCGHCQSINIMKERSCTQCGAPRATLIQEM